MISNGFRFFFLRPRFADEVVEAVDNEDDEELAYRSKVRDVVR